MHDILGYKIISTLYESEKNLILKVQDENNGIYTLKMLKDEYPSLNMISHIKQEYEITSQLKISKVRKAHAYKKLDKKHCLVLEYFEGQSLHDLIENKSLSISEFLEIAIKIANTLHEIHLNNIIHKDIKPQNILISPDNFEIRIIDFGIASKINLKHQYLGNPDLLEGTLSYLSPEQTGRMNRIVDYRSDLYSLGVTFYKILTGVLPFEDKESIEIIHSHIARKPKILHEVSPEIPIIISKVVSKLLEKNAEDRYQSAFGLISDLKLCKKRISEGHLYEKLNFDLGKDDFSGKFQIPEKLYGREDEVSFLMTTFNRISQGALELMLIAGYSGVGKSVLVYEVHKPITGKRGGFISGKFDQYQRDIPYYAFRQAFEQFVNQVLTESETKLEIWKQKILIALEDKGQVLIDIIPSIELFIGKQPDVPEVGPQEAQNRFNLVLKRFIEAISQKDHPLVIFIDDLQWADAASLNLLKVLMLDKTNQYLLIIGAYRDNEVNQNHPFIITLNDIKNEKAIIHDIKLNNLSFEDVNELAAETLNCSVSFSNKLTKLIYQKTLGNAFFTNEFLKSLYQDKLLSFDYENKKWKWDVNKISEKNITDNVVELMARKISKLPSETQEVLKLAACIGNKFDPDILSIIYEKSHRKTFEDIWGAMVEGLVVPLDHNYKKIGLLEDETLFELDRAEGADYFLKEEELKTEIHLKFQHDRVQQASYSLIDDKQKQETHLKIARLLFENTSEEQFYEHIFDITNQFNLGTDLIKDNEELLKLIDLNYSAGLKAKQSAAHHSALKYYNAASSLFPDDMWTNNRELAWKIFKEKAWTEYSCAHCEESEKSILIALKYSINEDEKVSLYQIYLGTLFTLNRHEDGLKVGREALAMLGINLPRKIGKRHIAIEFLKFNVRLGKRKAEDLYHLPNITNKKALNICAIVYDLVPSSYILNADYMAYISMISANHCLKYGNSKFASFSFGMAAIVYEGIVKNFKMAYNLSMMAINLNKKYPDLDAKARIHFLITNFSIHWVKPVGSYLPLMLTALNSALDAGSLNWANYAIAFCRTQSILFNQNSLEEIEKENLKYYQIHLNFKDPEVCNNHFFLLKFIQRLRNNYENEVTDLFQFDAESYHKEMLRKGNIMVRVYYFNFNLVEAYMFEDYDKALENCSLGFKIMFDSLGLLADFTFRFYYLLTLLIKKNTMSSSEWIKYTIPFRVNKFFIKRYALKCPENYIAHYYLILAEENRIEKKIQDAIYYYEKAISAAEKADFIQNRALCNELFAKFWLYQDNQKIAAIYMKEAHYLYDIWGAKSKNEQLERKYPFLLKSFSNKIFQSGDEKLKNKFIEISPSTSSSASSITTSSLFDIHSLMKATQAISQEVQLKILIKQLLQIVMENAGAERSVLILKEKDTFIVKARSNINANLFENIDGLPVEECSFIPLSVIHYVSRTKKHLLITDAEEDDQYNIDEYIKREKPKSIFCFPIISKGEISCLIYLENNLTTNAFTNERLEVLQLLSAQIAISIENSLLYENLEQKVAERTIELNEKNKRITDSIKYAKNIQNAILPTREELSKHLKEYFIIYKPKDIVSGDFYWFTKIEDSLFLAVIDCTGHGVPGAFMSLIADTLLSQLIIKHHKDDLALVLDQLHLAIRIGLKQDESDNTDGMDICIVKIKYFESNNFEISFVGAKRPLYIITDGEIKEYKGDRRAVGGLQRDVPFTNHKITLKTNDLIYLTTDGFVDTPNPERKSFGVKNLKKLLLENYQKPIIKQKKELLDTLNKYQQDAGQRDDITLFGVKL